MVIKSLENVTLEQILEAFNLAFLNYEINIHLSMENFFRMLDRENYKAEYSFGAFEEERLVGFVLTGVRMNNNKIVIYDCGTGIIPGYRNRGIAKKILKAVKNNAKACNAKCFLLEVLQNNAAAIEVYRELGFYITRELNCYQMGKEDLYNHIEASYNCCSSNSADKAINCEINDTLINLQYSIRCTNTSELTLEYEAKLKTIWSIQPSWQNDFRSICACRDEFLCIIAENKDALVETDQILGYEIVSKKSGEILQLVVQKKYQNNGIASQLLKKMIEFTPAKSLVILNVDKSDIDTNNALMALGFRIYTSQYEMALKF